MDNMSGLGIGNNYIENAVKASDKINAIKRNSGKQATDEEMMKACKEFETYLLEQVMKEVTKTVDIFGTGDNTTAAMSTLQDNAKDQLLNTMATQLTEDGSLGIAQKLYETMSRPTVSIDEVLAKQGVVAKTDEKKEEA